MRERVPDTPLPEVGRHDEAAHDAMSACFLEHYRIEHGKGNRLQASEKVWAVVAHAIKAAAEHRGWVNPSHRSLADVVRQLDLESASGRDLQRLYDSVAKMHYNYYENTYDWDVIEEAHQDAQEMAGKLSAIRNRGARSYTIIVPSDQRRVARLLGLSVPGSTNEERAEALDQLLPVGTTSSVGFSPAYGYRHPEDEDAGRSAHPAGPDA